jgi:hypothetical protein
MKPSLTNHEISSMSPENKKDAIENLIEELLLAIKIENRSLTKWEVVHISGAINASLGGMYNLAMSNIELCQVSASQVADVEKWWQDDDEWTVEKLLNTLAVARGYPARK